MLPLILTSFQVLSASAAVTGVLPPATLPLPYERLMTRAALNLTGTGWRLVRTPGPEKSGDVVSIMHTADTMQSDPEFAGLLIRCRPDARLQIGFITITPFHPRSHPKVTVTAGSTAAHFQAEVLPPGSLVALPNEAEALVRGPWQSAKDLSVDIEGDGAKIHGAVRLEDLSAAISQLQPNCP